MKDSLPFVETFLIHYSPKTLLNSIYSFMYDFMTEYFLHSEEILDIVVYESFN